MIIVEIAGHLGRDPEQRFTASGQKITTFSVATNSRRAGKDETVWWRVTIWGDRYEKMVPYLKKGSPVIVIGEMQAPQIYMDKDGKPQVSLELFAEILKFSPFGRPDRPEGAAAPQQGAMADQGQAPQNYNQRAYPPSSMGSNQSLAGSQASEAMDEEPLPF